MMYCNECGEGFKTLNERETHIRTEHSYKILRKNGEVQLERHQTPYSTLNLSKKKLNSEVACLWCDKTFKNTMKMLEHAQKEHK